MITQEEKVKEIVENGERPVSIQKISQKLGIAWGTARALLLSLTVEGEIRAVQTDKGWIFYEGNVRLL